MRKNNELKVATWNVGSLYTDYETNWPYLEQVIRNAAVDVLCVQEAPSDDSFRSAICALGGFAHTLFHITSASHIHTGHDMGIAVFSRFPVASLQRIRLDKPTVPITYNGKTETWHDKYFLAFTCDVGGQTIAMVTGHGFPFHRYGLENEDNYGIIQPSFLALDKWVDRLPADVRLLCMAADFNLRAPLSFMPCCARCFCDVFHNEATRPSGRKTDAILIPNGVSVMDKMNVSSPKNEGRALFDHNFIAATLRW